MRKSESCIADECGCLRPIDLGVNWLGAQQKLGEQRRSIRLEFVVDGKRAQVLQLLKVPNNYQPTWQVGYVGQRAFNLTWTDVPLDRDVRVRVHLEDFDPIRDNDTIATVEVNSGDLRRAAAARRVLPVYVGDQSSQQLMFVNVSVTSQ